MVPHAHKVAGLGSFGVEGSCCHSMTTFDVGVSNPPISHEFQGRVVDDNQTRANLFMQQCAFASSDASTTDMRGRHSCVRVSQTARPAKSASFSLDRAIYHVARHWVWFSTPSVWSLSACRCSHQSFWRRSSHDGEHDLPAISLDLPPASSHEASTSWATRWPIVNGTSPSTWGSLFLDWSMVFQDARFVLQRSKNWGFLYSNRHRWIYPAVWLAGKHLGTEGHHGLHLLCRGRMAHLPTAGIWLSRDLTTVESASIVWRLKDGSRPT